MLSLGEKAPSISCRRQPVWAQPVDPIVFLLVLQRRLVFSPGLKKGRNIRGTMGFGVKRHWVEPQLYLSLTV